MTRKLRVLGSAVIAVVAFGALAAAAQAQNGTLTSEAGVTSVKLSGSQITAHNHVFTVDAGTNEVSCRTATFAGSTGVPSSSVRLTPTYTQCEAFGFSATVTNEGCEYLFTIGPTIKASEYTSSVHLVCSAGKFIKINAGFGQCQLRVGDEKTGGAAANQGLNTVKFLNKTNATTGKEHLLVEALVGEINYDVTVKGPFCPLEKLGEKNDGTYTGDTTVNGTKTTGNPVHITISD